MFVGQYHIWLAADSHGKGNVESKSIFTSREAAWSWRTVGRKKVGTLAFLVIVTSVFGVFGIFPVLF